MIISCPLMLVKRNRTAKGRSPQMPMKSDWEPPYPAFSAAFDDQVDQVVMAYYGLIRDTSAPAITKDFMIHLGLRGNDAPTVVNRAVNSNGHASVEDVFVLYWTDPASYRRWESERSHWWLSDDRLHEGVGYWREVFAPPMDHLETLISSHEPIGLAEAMTEVRGPIREHAYWGAVRDRIPASALNPLESSLATLPEPRPPIHSKGQRLRITPHENLCIIRSGQNWSDCGPEERRIYASDLAPVLREGMEFLRTHPLESGCLSCRLMDQLQTDGSKTDKTFATALFLSLRHLEEWAEHHPTHLAIFKTFHDFVRKRNFAPELKLWHEVAVLPANSVTCEYINCPPMTGLLPYYQAEIW
ncbi:MAG: phenylacetaldoxime dehydratase family protein [Alphaproteobacteria bacterium]|nr:MAG: phenylacetaldoxime dehydratase family protein [Alphaproteobacteria bacterium]